LFWKNTQEKAFESSIHKDGNSWLPNIIVQEGLEEMSLILSPEINLTGTIKNAVTLLPLERAEIFVGSLKINGELTTPQNHSCASVQKTARFFSEPTRLRWNLFPAANLPNYRRELTGLIQETVQTKESAASTSSPARSIESICKRFR
jgi:hypothetical protein